MRRAVGRAVATAAGALGVTAGAAGVAVQSDAFEHDQRDRARQAVRSVDVASAGAPARAVSALDGAGVCVLRGSLSCEVGADASEALSQLLADTGVDITTALRGVGAVASMMLPTIHQADSWKNAALGGALAQRGAAMLASRLQQNEPCIAGCVHALDALRAHLAPEPLPRAAHWRAHALCLQQDADAALAGGFGDASGGSDALEADAPPEGAGRASLVSASGPTATLVRAWANVLLAPAACWSVLLDALCDARGEALHQRRTTLVVFDDPDRAAAPDAPSVPADSEARDQADAPAPPALPASLLARAHDVWGRLWWLGGGAARGGVLVLVPLPRGAAAEGAPPEPTQLELLLPRGPLMQAVRLSIPAGGAIALDARVRWRPADARACAGGAPSAAEQAFIVFEYGALGPVAEGGPVAGHTARALASAVAGVAVVPASGESGV